MTVQGLPEARRRCEEALALAEEIGAAPEAAYARMVLGVVLGHAGEPEAGEAHLRTAIAELADHGRPDDLLYAHLYLAEVLRLLGRFADALAVSEEGERHARRLGMEASFGRFLALNAATDEFLLGRWERADHRLAAVDGDDLEPWNAIARGQVAGQLLLARGRLDDAARELESARTCCEGAPAECGPAVYAGLAELELWRGRHAEARAVVEDGLTAVHGAEELLYAPTLYAMGVRVDAEAARVAATVGDEAERQRASAHARQLLARLESLVERDDAPPSAVAHREAARAELARGEGEGGAGAWAAAAAAWQAVGAPYAEAYARWRGAEAVLRDGGSRADATESLRHAHATTARLGAELMRREIEALARRARVDVGVARAETGDESFPLESLGLTARELEVLALVGEGLTNREIGQRLFITPKTAGLHVSHILSKLSVSNRTKAAEIAHRAQLA